jgi:hypothetical protein
MQQWIPVLRRGLGAHSFGPDMFSRVHIIQFVAIGTIVTGAQGFFSARIRDHVARVLFGRTVLGNATFQKKAIHGV